MVLQDYARQLGWRQPRFPFKPMEQLRKSSPKPHSNGGCGSVPPSHRDLPICARSSWAETANRLSASLMPCNYYGLNETAPYYPQGIPQFERTLLANVARPKRL
jgi:hypothetical protein